MRTIFKWLGYVFLSVALGGIFTTAVQAEPVHPNDVKTWASLQRYLYSPTFPGDASFKGANGYDMAWDASLYTLFLEDNTILAFGNTSATPDIYMRWDETNFDILSSTAGYDFTFGTNSLGIDLIWNSDTAGSTVTFAEETLAIQLAGRMVIQFAEQVAPATATHGSDHPPDNHGWLYAKDSSGVAILYFEDKDGTVHDLTAAAGGNSLDGAYNAGSTIDVDGNAVTLTVSTTDNNAVLALVQEDVSQSAGNDPNALEITMTALSDGDAINITSADTANDIVGANWSVDGLGALIAVSADLTGAAGLILANDGTLTNNTDGYFTFTDGGEDLSIYLNANTATLSSVLLVDQIAFGSVDNLTGIDDIAFDAGTTSSITKASTANADFTIGMTGAADASLILSSTGTTGDALQLVTTAGGITIIGGGAAGGEDIHIDSVLASVLIDADEDVADAIYIHATAGGIDILADGAVGKDLDLGCTSGSVNITAGEATSNASVSIQASGGIDVDAVDDIILTLVSSADADDFRLIQTGAHNVSITMETTGTGADAILLAASVGGITVTVPTAKAILMGGTSGSNMTLGNVAGDFAVAGDNIDFTATAATDNVFQIASSASSQVLFDIDLGATDAIAIGDNANAGATTVVGATFTATGGIGGTSGAGGATTVQGGTGGIAIAATSVGGAGGALSLAGGIGGAGLTNQAGGAGGAITAVGGVGGVAHGTGNAAAGGNASLTAGAGGVGVSGGGDPGAAGTVAVTAGAGGGGTTADSGAAGGTASLVGGVGGIGAAAKSGGAGGAVSVTGGAGGASLTGTSGVGGQLNLAGGAEGSKATGTGATGGAVNIDGGAGVTGGAVTIDAGAGSTTDGSITIGATDALALTMGNSTADVTITSDNLAITNGGDVHFGTYKTVIKTIDCVAAGTTDDFSFDSDGDANEQAEDLGALIPAYAEIVAVQIRCFEAVVGGTMSIDIGITTGAGDILAACAPDALNEVFGGAANSAPIIGVTNAARNVWVNATPSANWNTLSAGRYAVMVTYLDFGDVYTNDGP